MGYSFCYPSPKTAPQVLGVAESLRKSIVLQHEDIEHRPDGDPIPTASMYGIFTYMYHRYQPNVGIYNTWIVIL